MKSIALEFLIIFGGGKISFLKFEGRCLNRFEKSLKIQKGSGARLSVARLATSGRDLIVCFSHTLGIFIVIYSIYTIL
jgi:hypothetical protein